jgi:hypothetical protein
VLSECRLNFRYIERVAEMRPVFARARSAGDPASGAGAELIKDVGGAVGHAKNFSSNMLGVPRRLTGLHGASGENDRQISQSPKPRMGEIRPELHKFTRLSEWG